MSVNVKKETKIPAVRTLATLQFLGHLNIFFLSDLHSS